MASQDDYLTALHGLTQNVGQLVAAFGAPGRYVTGTASPVATLQTALGSTALAIVNFNMQRRGISFHSALLSNTTIYLSTLPSVSTAGGITLLPGQSLFISSDLATNATWFAAAATSSATNGLLVLEFV